MLSIGISEVIVIILVICLVIEPKKLPLLAKDLGIYYKKFMNTKKEIIDYLNKGYINQQETQHDNVTIKEIIGNDGKTYTSYEIKKTSNNEEKL